MGENKVKWVVREKILIPSAIDADVPQKTEAPDYYRTTHRKDYIEPKSIGWSSIPVLEFLNGLPWDDLALGFLHAVNPSCIRVTDGCTKCDAITGRVTVYLKEDSKTIKKITQEVRVGLPDGINNGHELNIALRKAKERK